MEIKIGYIKPANLSKQMVFNTPSQKGQFTKIINALELSFSQIQEIHELLEQLKTKDFNEQKTRSLLASFDAETDKITINLPKQVQKKIKALRKLQNHLDYIGKFKTNLPLLSYLMRHYEKEEAPKSIFVDIWLDILRGSVLDTTNKRGWEVESPLTALTPTGRVVEGITIFRTAENNIQFTCGAAICVDGAPNAYGPNDSGADYTASAGHSKGQIRYKRDNKGGFVLKNGEKVPEYAYPDTDWWGVWTHNGKSDGEPVVKEDGYYISMSSYVYEGQPDNVQKRYVNANIVSFAVLSRESMGPLGLKIGDLVYVYNKRVKKGKWASFLETRRKDDKIGEVSAALADALDISSNPRIGGQNGDVVYTFYPNTGPDSRFRSDAETANYIHRNGKNIEAGKPIDKNPRIPS